MSRLNQFLNGYKVVDLSRHLPGPLASMLLADLGAEVTKVEPLHGDEMRYIGPQGSHGNSVYFDTVNAGKSGVMLNLKEQAGRDTLLNLLQDADILIESFRPGVLDKLALGIDFLRSIAPKLVICSLNGYGDNSPLRSTAGHDLNYLAMNGLLEGTGTREKPVAPWPPIADCTASLFGLSTLLAALLERERSGRGCHVEVALADSVMPLMSLSLAELGLTQRAPPRCAALLNGGAARYQTYLTQDQKAVALGGVEPKFWLAFCAAAGRDEWQARIDEALPQTSLIAELTAFFATLTIDECRQRFAHADCCFNEVLDLSEAVHTAHSQARKLVVQTNSGEYQALYPAYVDGEPPAPRNRFQKVQPNAIHSREC